MDRSKKMLLTWGVKNWNNEVDKYKDFIGVYFGQNLGFYNPSLNKFHNRLQANEYSDATS